MMLLRIVGAIWVLPIALPIWLVYLGPAWALGLHKLIGAHGDRLALRFAVSASSRWYRRLWNGWTGLALPFAVIVVAEDIHPLVIRHELRHCDQWLWLGPLFPFVYGILLLGYGYQDHPLEEDAEDWARSGEGE